MGYDMNSLVRTQLERSFPAHMEGNQLGAYGAAPPIYYQPVMAKDGQWIQPANLVDHLFHAFIATIGLEDIYLEERFHGAPRRLAEADREELRERMLRRVLERDGAEWMELFRNAQNVAAEPFGNTTSALSNADLVANGEVVEVEHPRFGPVRQLGLVANLTQTPGTVGAPAAEPGEQTAEILAEQPRAAWTPPTGAGATARAPARGRHGPRVRNRHRGAVRRGAARRPRCARDQDRADRGRALPWQHARPSRPRRRGEDDRRQGGALPRPEVRGRPGDRREADRGRRRAHP